MVVAPVVSIAEVVKLVALPAETQKLLEMENGPPEASIFPICPIVH